MTFRVGGERAGEGDGFPVGKSGEQVLGELGGEPDLVGEWVHGGVQAGGEEGAGGGVDGSEVQDVGEGGEDAGGGGDGGVVGGVRHGCEEERGCGYQEGRDGFVEMGLWCGRDVRQGVERWASLLIDVRDRVEERRKGRRRGSWDTYEIGMLET